MFAKRFHIPSLVWWLAAGCSSPGDDNAVTPAADMGPDVAAEPDVFEGDTGGEDVGVPDFGPTIYPVFEESEPNSMPSEARAFTQPAIITGHVQVGDDVIDWWETDLAGPAVLRITIQQGDVGWVELQTPQVSKRGLVGGPGATREFFVPRASRYQIGVLATDGKPDVTYRLQVESYEPTPVMLSGTTVQGDLEDGNVDVYQWISPGPGFTVVEVFGQRAPISGGLDSFLFVYDDSLDSVVWNDDAQGAGKDSRLDFERRDGAEYLIAVDMYEPTDDRRYELRIQAN